jgi:hypothetical protein
MKKAAMDFVMMTLALLLTVTARTQSQYKAPGYYIAKSVAIGHFDKDDKVTLEKKEKVNISIIVKDQAIIVDDEGSNFYVTHGTPVEHQKNNWKSITFYAKDKNSKDCSILILFSKGHMPTMSILYKAYVVVYEIDQVKK